MNGLGISGNIISKIQVEVPPIRAILVFRWIPRPASPDLSFVFRVLAENFKTQVSVGWPSAQWCSARGWHIREIQQFWHISHISQIKVKLNWIELWKITWYISNISPIYLQYIHQYSTISIDPCTIYRCVDLWILRDHAPCAMPQGQLFGIRQRRLRHRGGRGLSFRRSWRSDRWCLETDGDSGGIFEVSWWNYSVRSTY